jgi:hypothetical protein
MFRQPLLCRGEEAVARTPRAASIELLAVSTQVRRCDLEALERAADAWPAAVWVRDLVVREADAAGVCDALLRACAANLATLHSHPPRLTTTPGHAPSTTALARRQAHTGDVVTNLRHTNVGIATPLARQLVTLLDGTRDRAALAASLRAFLTDRGEPVPDDLEDTLSHGLTHLARLALLER